MTILEIINKAPKQGLLEVGQGCQVYVEVVNIKQAYGVVRYQVRPLSGQGTMWIDSSRLLEMVA